MGDDKQTWCGDPFSVENIKLLCYTPETNIISQFYLNEKKCINNVDSDHLKHSH